MARLSHMLILLISLLILLFSCTGNRKEPKNQVKRHFPMVEVPQMMDGDYEKADWVARHIWDRFLDTAAFYGSDSLTINGIDKTEVEQQIGTYVTILESIPPKNAGGFRRTFPQVRI